MRLIFGTLKDFLKIIGRLKAVKYEIVKEYFGIQMVRCFKDKKGYKRFSDSGKLVHRHVAERKMGRKLKSGEVVHHRNRDKTDNRRSNLRVMRSQKEHHKLHKRSKRRYGRW